MHKLRSYQKELIDFPDHPKSILIQNLKEFEFVNQWLGTQKVLIDSLNKIYNENRQLFSERKMCILDLGCGSGDLLRAVSAWGKARNLSLSLIGIDNNPLFIERAMGLSKSNIEYQVLDIFSDDFNQFTFDIACLNNVCHHFSDEEFLCIMKKLMHQSRVAIVVNDLQRNGFAYFLIKLLTKLFNFSYLARNDGPLSVLRAFKKWELVDILSKLPYLKVILCKRWAFRWQMIIWCNPRGVHERSY